MIEWLMEFWLELSFGLLIVAFLLLIIFVSICYEEQKRKYEEDEFADLKKMMPKLPKDRKKK